MFGYYEVLSVPACPQQATRLMPVMCCSQACSARILVDLPSWCLLADLACPHCESLGLEEADWVTPAGCYWTVFQVRRNRLTGYAYLRQTAGEPEEAS